MKYSLYQRGQTWWVTANVDGVRVRQSTGTGDRKLAERRAQEMVQDAREGREDWSLGRALERTAAVRWDGTRGEETALVNAQAAVDYYGAGTSVDTISTARLDDYVEHLKRLGNSNGTINRKLSALSAILRTAHERGGLRTMPKVPRLKEGVGRLRWLSEAEERDLLRVLGQLGRDEELRLTVFLLDTGLRLGEALRLEVRDVPAGAGTGVVHVWESKADKPRSVPLTRRAAEAVPGGRVGRVWRITKSRYWHNLRRAMTLARIEGASIHTLRHTFASRLVQKGVPLASIQALLGHKCITTTMRYAHISDANLADAVAVLEERAGPDLRRVK